ncbi:MAG: hypothetical protein IJL54_07380 [Prevotella sp.]|nr:hypothetical protein [Prevotella sp.]
MHISNFNPIEINGFRSLAGLAKTNYILHTDVIKKIIIPKLTIEKKKEGIIYVSEADMLNLTLFGYTTKDREEAYPELTNRKPKIPASSKYFSYN